MDFPAAILSYLTILWLIGAYIQRKLVKQTSQSSNALTFIRKMMLTCLCVKNGFADPSRVAESAMDDVGPVSTHNSPCILTLFSG